MVAGLLVRLAQSLAETGDQDKAEYYFKEADKIYKVVPGPEHPFYTEVCQHIIMLTMNISIPLGTLFPQK